MITAELLREMLDYDPSTGELTWKVKANKRFKIGDRALSLDGHGYLRVMIHGRHYQAHRLAWLHVHGRWPDQQIDHINGSRADNRLCNLREANQTQNNANTRLRCDNTSGFKGVSWDKTKRRWQALIRVNGRAKHLGRYDTPEAAHAAYASAAQKTFGEFARTAS